MKTILRFGLAGFLGTLAAATAASADATVELIDGVYGMSISSDGTVIAGNLVGNYETFRWTEATGVVPLGMSSVEVLGTGAGGPDISADGTRISATILGADSTYSTQGRWTLGQGWEETMPPPPPDGGTLDGSYGSAWGLSDDGETVVGLYWRPNQPGGLAYASSWTDTGGLVGLSSGDANGRANDCNADGSVIVGWTEADFGNWQATVWVDGVMEVLEDNIGWVEAKAVSPDGLTVYGMTHDDDRLLYDAAAWDWDGSAWNKRVLGSLPGTAPEQGRVAAVDATSDGRVVVGFNQFFFGNYTGFVWTEETGMVDIVDFLADRGVTLPFSFDPQGVNAISDDGSVLVLVGQSMVFPFGGQTYVIRLDHGVDAPEIAAAAGDAASMRAWPNPTRGATKLSLELPRAAEGTVGIYDTTGRLVRRIASGRLPSGRQDLTWDGRNGGGGKVAAGVYWIRLEAGTMRETSKLVMVR